MRVSVVFAFFLGCIVSSAWTRSPLTCICTMEYAPVCGANGKTYGNACAARCDRMEVKCNGECPCTSNPGSINPGPVNPAACSCAATSSPVCGTNERTYGNKCLAACDNAKVACEGKCPCGEKCDAPYVRCARNPCDGARCPKYPKAECRMSNCKACTAEFYLNGKKIDDCGKSSGCLCTEQYSPVCGTDQKTYSNDCFAKCKDVKIQCKGTCPCPKTKPCACPKIYRPVCGNDDQTYANECLAECENVEIACQGKCPCKTKPAPCVCTREYQPVCGVNGKTYGNKCEAACTKTKIKCTGKCPCETKEEECNKGTVACIVDPCSYASCPAYPRATCKANYCGGCNADFYLNGKKVKCEKSDNLLCAKQDQACDTGNTYNPYSRKCCSGLTCCQPCRPIHIQPYALPVDPGTGTCRDECLLCIG